MVTDSAVIFAIAQLSCNENPCTHAHTTHTHAASDLIDETVTTADTRTEFG